MSPRRARFAGNRASKRVRSTNALVRASKRWPAGAPRTRTRVRAGRGPRSETNRAGIRVRHRATIRVLPRHRVSNQEVNRGASRAAHPRREWKRRHARHRRRSAPHHAPSLHPSPSPHRPARSRRARIADRHAKHVSIVGKSRALTCAALCLFGCRRSLDSSVATSSLPSSTPPSLL
jgi:hypothetical protein